MATLIAARPVARPDAGERVHRLLIASAAIAGILLVLFLIVTGLPYYRLPLEERPLSPLHAQLRSSGVIGLRLGIGSFGMFCLLMLYPLRKRWRWLSTIGSTRRWLNFHVLLGIFTPLIVTFHTAFKWRGLAGVAYGIMVAVALSGFVGRYIYAKIPRSRNAVKLTAREIEDEYETAAASLAACSADAAGALAQLLHMPSPAKIRSMGMARVLWTVILMDLARPFQLRRLRRGLLQAGAMPAVNAAVRAAGRQARLRAGLSFLERTERVFYLWHVIHRPFSISFVVLILIHIGIAISVGF